MVQLRLSPSLLGTILDLGWDCYTLLGLRSYNPLTHLVHCGADMLRYRDQHIRSLSATFGRYSDHDQTTCIVKYEKQVVTNSDIHDPPLSKFALLVSSCRRTYILLNNSLQQPHGPNNYTTHWTEAR